MKHLLYNIFVFGGIVAAVLPSHAAPKGGDVDLTFDRGTPVNGRVHSMVLQPDGKMVLGSEGHDLMRLNSDGTLDPTFSVSSFDKSSIGSDVYAIAMQPDGKFLVGFGNGTYFGQGIARINADGSIDPSFLYGMEGIKGPVSSIVLQADGKVLVSGNFSSVNGIVRNNIARLNADGSLDHNFQNGMAGVEYIAGGYPTVFSVAVQVDGKVLIGGDFDSVNEISRTGIARLNTDGSLDTGFQHAMEGPQLGDFYYTNFYNGTVSSIAMQADGKVLVGGYFEFFNGVPRSGIARLNSDGGLDLNFLEGMAGIGRFGSVQSVTLQNDGKVLIGAAFNTTVDGLFASGLARLYGTIPSLDDGGVIANQFGFNITGYPGQLAVVEASTNLLNWIPLQTNTLSVGSLSFTDPDSSSFPKRFYRARLQ